MYAVILPIILLSFDIFYARYLLGSLLELFLVHALASPARVIAIE